MRRHHRPRGSQPQECGVATPLREPRQSGPQNVREVTNIRGGRDPRTVGSRPQLGKGSRTGLQLVGVDGHALVGDVQRLGRLEGLTRVLTGGQQLRRALADANLHVDLLLQVVLLE